MRLSILLVCTASLSALHAQDGSIRAVTGDAFDLRVGQHATIAAERLSVGFERVVAESRCPRGAQCIREGEATIAVWIQRGPAARRTAELTTPSRTGADAAVEGPLTLTLRRLTPHPDTGRQTRPEDYIATLAVTR